MSSSLTVADATSLVGEIEKDTKHDDLVSSSGALISLSLDSCQPGNFENHFFQTITSNNTVSQVYNNFMQQLSVSLWNFAARLMDSRLLLVRSIEREREREREET